jgi:hypothetical protein
MSVNRSRHVIDASDLLMQQQQARIAELEAALGRLKVICAIEVEAATANEREACARIADEWAARELPGYSPRARPIAAAIRARGSK